MFALNYTFFSLGGCYCNLQMKESWDYAIRGMLDGTLATLGVVIGARGAAPEIIIAAGISGGVANSISNILAAFSAQKTVMLNDLREVEDAMIEKDLKGSYTHQEKQKEVRLKSIYDGVATLLGALVPVVPFFFFAPQIATYTAIGLTSILGFWVGFIMGKLSRRNVLYLGAKMAIIAIIVALASAIIQNGLDFVLTGGS